LIILDPLAKIHTAPENDNSAMTTVLEAVEKLAMITNAAVMVLAHTSKPGGASAGGLAGNIDAMRGASAIKDSVRACFTLSPPVGNDLTTYGLIGNQAARYLRLDDAKMNRGLMTTDPVWIEKHSITLPGIGESVGAFSLANLQPAGIAQMSLMADLICAEFDRRAAANSGQDATKMSRDEAIQAIRRSNLYQKVTDDFVKVTLMSNFMNVFIPTSLKSATTGLVRQVTMTKVGSAYVVMQQ